jgi:hypothetical protein
MCAVQCCTAGVRVVVARWDGRDLYTPHTYPAALAMMLVSMLCWGSWANTQKIDRAWRFELFYWDYMWGILVCALLFGLTMGRTDPAAPASFFHNLVPCLKHSLAA